MLTLNDKKARASCLALALLAAGCDSGSPAAVKPQLPAPAAQTTPVQTPATPQISTEQALQMRIADHPSDAEAKIQLANLYYDHGRHLEAIPMYVEALELDPGNISVRTDLGTCYVATKQYPYARAAYQQVLQEDPEHLNSTFNMGVLESIEGNYSEAATLWTRAQSLSTNPEQAQKLQEMAEQARQRAIDPPPEK